MEPDLTGFAEAQSRLIGSMGQDVVFVIPGEPEYPDGTKLDPQTGRPFDPRIKPTTTGDEEKTVKCSVAFRPVGGGLEDTAKMTAIGRMAENNVVLITGIENKSDLEGASTATVMDVKYKVTDMTEDGIEEATRLLIFLESK